MPQPGTYSQTSISWTLKSTTIIYMNITPGCVLQTTLDLLLSKSKRELPEHMLRACATLKVVANAMVTSALDTTT